ncbi:unnamed protein product [Arctia plantaginis]|uniref:Uncharacterized protein n=1 Tax=Arctia plantaginis TaxID=874455 RepID=A0A8S1AVZ3_ARCPL|nr:unnamed protein product [Arctia plantaginis]
MAGWLDLAVPTSAVSAHSTVEVFTRYTPESWGPIRTWSSSPFSLLKRDMSSPATETRRIGITPVKDRDGHSTLPGADITISNWPKTEAKN